MEKDTYFYFGGTTFCRRGQWNVGYKRLRITGVEHRDKTV
jgi:hypothetical protein